MIYGYYEIFFTPTIGAVMYAGIEAIGEDKNLGMHGKPKETDRSLLTDNKVLEPQFDSRILSVYSMILKVTVYLII